MRFVLSGGGTAGHVYPALTVAAELSAGGRDEVVFVGTSSGVEARLVPEAGVRSSTLPARGFDRGRAWTLLTSSAVLAWSTLRAYSMLGRERPDAVVGFGGYVSIPVGLAAVLRGIPVVLHEQNSVPGLANRLLSRWARAVGVTYEASAAHLRHPERAVVTGNPVRPAVLAADRTRGREALGLADDATVLLVFGGSRGARHVNTATIALAERLLDIPGVVVVHVAGRAEAASVREGLAGLAVEVPSRYHVEEYIDDMGSAIAAADVVVARAGATSIAEITALGRAAVLVPYPYATDDHQTLNARAVEQAGACVLVADADIDSPRFAEAVTSLLEDVERRRRMAEASRGLGRPDAASAVAKVVRDAVGAKGRP